MHVVMTETLQPAQPQLAAPKNDGQAGTGTSQQTEGPCYSAKPHTFTEETYNSNFGPRRFCIDCGTPEPMFGL